MIAHPELKFGAIKENDKMSERKRGLLKIQLCILEILILSYFM